MVYWYTGDSHAVDVQGTGHNGTLVGGATYAAGMVDQAFSLNGTSAFVVADGSALDPTTAGSQDAWVYFNQKPSAAGRVMEIIGRGDFGRDFDLLANVDDLFHFYVGGGVHVDSTTVIQTGVWYHVAGTWDSTGGLKMYVNGQLEGTNPAQVTRTAGGISALVIGEQAVFPGRYFNGRIDEVELFSRALTQAEVQAIFNAGTAGKCKVQSKLANISTRMRVETGDNALFGGIIVTGNQDKKILLRAIGPSLSFTDKLQDPILELHDSSGATLETNDNWMNSPNKQAIIDSTIPPTNPSESAILRTLAPGNYTAIVRGVNDTTGIALVEAYDLSLNADSKLANIATRGLVQAGNNVMIGGFIVVGQTSQRVIVRAIGPSLSIPGKLADPMLEFYDGNGTLLQSNDNWRTDQEAEIMATTIPPTHDAESAIVRTLGPGNYTAIVKGVNSGTGIGLVEVYALQ
jgi:hypothetical protein